MSHYPTTYLRSAARHGVSQCTPAVLTNSFDICAVRLGVEFGCQLKMPSARGCAVVRPPCVSITIYQKPAHHGMVDWHGIPSFTFKLPRWGPFPSMSVIPRHRYSSNARGGHIGLTPDRVMWQHTSTNFDGRRCSSRGQVTCAACSDLQRFNCQVKRRPPYM